MTAIRQRLPRRVCDRQALPEGSRELNRTTQKCPRAEWNWERLAPGDDEPMETLSWFALYLRDGDG